MEFLLAFMLVLYLLPWVLAESLGHPRANAILGCVLLLGWTGLGWLVTLVWALAARRRARPGPRLALVGRDPLPSRRPLAGSLARWPLRRALATGAAIVAAAGLIAWTAGAPTPRLPASGQVEPSAGHVVLRMGPHRAWPAVGTARSPCRFEVLEREGAWRHLWRLEGCESDMTGRSGWARIETLRAAPRLAHAAHASRDPSR